MNKITYNDRDLVRLLVPILADQFLAILVGLADSLMSAAVGSAAISAVSLVDSVSNLMIYIFSAMAAGGAAVAGQYLGRKEEQNARAAGQHLVLLLGAVSFAVMLLLYIFKTDILRLLFGSIAPDVMAATNRYYTIVMASIPAIALYNGGAALFRVMSKSDIPFRTSVLMNGMNVAGNALLIFGFHMDVTGVAIPTLISRWTAAVVIFILLANPDLTLSVSGIRSMKPDRKLLHNILYISLPSGAENGMFYLGRLILFSFISTFGTASIVANAIGNTLGVFHCFAGNAVAMGLVTVISQCAGAGDHEGARYYMKRLTLTSYALMAAVNLTLMVLLVPILNLYGVSGEARHLAMVVSLIHGSAAILIWTPSFLIAHFLRACGDASFTMVISMMSMWIFRVLFAWIFARIFGLGLIGVWLAHSYFDWTVRSIIFILRYRSGIWRKKAIA